jgi:hypothetical protein
MSEIDPKLLPIILEPGTTRFEAGGHTYHVERDARLSIGRDRWLEKFGLYAVLGRDAITFLKEVRKAYDYNNQGKPGDTAVTLDNLMKGAADLNAKEAPLYYVCTLFINRTDEDRRSFDLELAKQKIQDWTDAGLERSFFLSGALSFLTISAQAFEVLMAGFNSVEGIDLSLTPPPPPAE